MNTLMNSHNGRAEEAATLADTIGRQKHGLCSPARRPSQSESSKWEQERKRERVGAPRRSERENEWDGRERRRRVGQRTCIICEKKRNSFTPIVFGVAVRSAGPVMTLGFDRQQNCRTDDIGAKRHDCLSSAAELCTRALAP
jgi:hypothetical protein